ncbi:peptide deformylase [Nakamurella sp. YIM 132087]|uniref:Peptide deformylase n=1 Tax=Nakamurella alba TaxID=2665158 RepID=A0A7K1FT32_9ACTN|nr:peptide deformylase [Nakamurella alba]MTD17316.1 peptide deformylase [Nakamurella alba]
MASLATRVERLLDGPRPLPIVQAGDPVLRTPARPYAEDPLEPGLLAALIAAMRETMLAAPGVGLAAPQVGLGVRIAVIEDTAAVPTSIALARERTPVPFRVLVDPSYEAVDDELVSFYEGCLSVAGYQAVVARSRAVRLRCTDEQGRAVDEELTGWPARIVAHEVDHLDGMLYLDRAVTRSLTSNENYLSRWATPVPDVAGQALGF